MSSVIRRKIPAIRDAPYYCDDALTLFTLPEFGVVLVSDVEGFRILEPDSVHIDIRNALLAPGSELVAMVRADSVGTSPICAYFFEEEQHDDKSSGPCNDFLGEIGLLYTRDRPKRALIVRQKTEHDLPIALTRRDMEKLQHIYLKWQRNVERDAIYENMEAPSGEDFPPEPEYEKDSLDESWSEFYSPSSDDEDDLCF
jgi:hypothetical protein